MSQQVIVELIENDTPVTNATVTLTDEDGTYAIRRATDNVVVVPASPTVTLTHTGSGVYVYEFEDAEDDVEYEARVKVVWPSGGTDYTDKILQVVPGDTVTDGYYAGYDDLQLWLGLENIEVVSDVDQNREINAPRVSAALAQADREINLALRKVGYAYPVSTGSPYFSTFTNIAVKLAAYWMYSAHSSREDDEGLRQNAFIKVSTWYKRAKSELKMLLLQARDLSRAGTAPNYPTGV